MSLSRFIEAHVEPIMVEFEAFARTMIPPAETMSVVALRDHGQAILLAIARDMESDQTESQRTSKSRGLAIATDTRHTAAAAHGAMRQLVGFNLQQLGAEYRALRATVLRQWQSAGGGTQPGAFEQMIRFNEGIDQALAESIAAYSDRMNQSRDMFLAVLGHDLRSPLGALSGCIQLLESIQTPAPARARSLVIANRSVSTINQMITDLLEYTKTRLGRGIEIRPVEGNLDGLCQQVFDEMRAAQPGRAMTYGSSGDLGAEFDPARMRQVIANLLGNAIQHGDPAHPVTLETTQRGDKVCAVVANHGDAIPEHALQVIFDPMVRIAKTPTKADERPTTSLGLGLYIAREIVNAHGGSIDVASSAESGTSFTVTLPRRAGQAA